jgi:hypothetical protein
VVGCQERLGLARREGVPVDRIAQALLLGASEGAQLQGDRQRELAAVQPRRRFRREAPCQRQPPFDPQRLAAQELGNRAFGMSVVPQRPDHARLVHGAGGLPGRVRVQEARFHGRSAFDRLDDDRDFRAAFRGPPGQAFEAIQNLERPVSGGGHAQRQGGEFGAVGPLAAQRREVRPQARDRHQFNERHRGPPAAESGTAGSGRR